MTHHDKVENNPEPPPEVESGKNKESSTTEPKKITITDIELEQIKKEASEYKDKYLRSIAEAENLRKRLHKERHDMTQLAIQGVMTDFLNPIDHLENALAFTSNMSDEVKNWATGFKMILNQFKDVLASNDVHPFKSVGMPFDPHNHEAVEMIETKEHPPGTVIEESIRGYKMGSKTIRPARVKVSKASTPVKSKELEEQAPLNNNENKPETENNQS